MPSPIKVFCCYAHEDILLLERLKIGLEPFRRAGLISVWDDCDITAGVEWEKELQKHLDAAQIVLLLVSPSFIASDYCYSVGMKRALERHDRGEARVIPIILRPTHWQDVLGKLKALPADAKPVIDRHHWYDIDAAFFDVADGIRKVIYELQEKQVAANIGNYFEVESTHPGGSVSKHTEKEGYLAKGAEDFMAGLDTIPLPAKMFLQKLSAWAISLEQAGLVNLFTYHGKGGILTLLPRLKVDDAGLVSIYNNHGTAYIQFWRSVFERRASHALASIEASMTPIKQGNTSREVSEELLEMLTRAYHEAAENS